MQGVRDLPALTGVRFVAAAHVVIYHALRPLVVDANTPWARVLAAGPSAVTLFFVLSGFVLTWSLPDGPLGARQFFRARLARIVPVYWLALLVVLPLGAIARAKGIVVDPLGPWSFIAVACGVQAWLPQAALRWNPPAWSLSCELFFYALLPFVVPALMRARRITSGAFVIAAWTLALAIAWAAQSAAGVVDARITDDTPLLALLKFFPPLRAPEFFFGVWAALLCRRGVRVPRVAAPLAIAASVAVVASGTAPAVALHNGLLAPLFAVLVMGLADRDAPLARALSTRALVLLGHASYALYLLHVPLMVWTAAMLRTTSLQPLPALLAGALSVPVAIVVLLTVERPLRARFRAAAMT